MEPQNNNPDPEGSNATSELVESGTSLSSDNEERFYRQQDLIYKKRGLSVSIAGFVLVISGLLVNIFQSEKVAKSIRSNVENEVVTRVLDLDEVFIREPELTPYFYNGTPINKEDAKYFKVSATAVMVLDVFDMVASQNRHYPEFWDTPEAWDDWMIDTFSTSPILRDTFDKYPCWYGTSLWNLRQKAEERLGGKPTQTSPCKRPESGWNWQLTILWIAGGLLFAFLPPGPCRVPLIWFPEPPRFPSERQHGRRRFVLHGIIGAIGGFVGGWLFYSVWLAQERISSLEAVATLAGSYLGAQLLVIVYGLLTMGRASRVKS